MKHQDGNESDINKTKEEEAFIKRLMSMNFKKMSYNMWYILLLRAGKNDRIGKTK